MSQCLSLRINKLLDKAEIVSTLDELWYKCIEGNDFKRFEEKDFLSFSWVELSINLDNKKNITELYTRVAWLYNFFDIDCQNN